MSVDLNIKINNAESAIKNVKFFSNYLSKKSLSSMAKDNIMQVPCYFDSNIDVVETQVIAKMLEQQFAAFVLLVLNDKCIIDIAKYGSITEYIKHNIHNNDNSPNLLDFTSNAIGLARRLNAPMPGLESAKENKSITQTDYIAMECWIDPEDTINQKSLNDIYKPFDKWCSIMESVISDYNARNVMSTAMEAGKDNGKNNQANQINKDDPYKFNKDRSDKYKSSNRNLNMLDATARVLGANDNRPLKTVQSPKVVDYRLGLMAPTMIDIDFLIHGYDNRGNAAGVMPKGNTALTNQHAMLGVKSMIRRVTTEQMVDNMTQAVTDSHAIFTFIKWTEGELKLKDILFNMSNYKSDALASRTGRKWLTNLRKRSKNAKFDKGIMPCASIILSSIVVDQIKYSTGINLYEPASALKVMEKFSLLSLVIYDTSTKVISQILHGYDNYTDSTLDSVKSNISKDVTMNSMGDFMKILGKNM